MARNNPKVSPEVAVELVDLACQMRRMIDGVPEWGTKFSRIEADALEVGRELSRLIMEQAVGEQAQRVPSPALGDAEAEEPAAVIGTQPSVIETTAGEDQWNQPKTRLSKVRRFFPSGQSVGRRCGSRAVPQARNPQR